jgi:hypothetical protein
MYFYICVYTHLTIQGLKTKLWGIKEPWEAKSSKNLVNDKVNIFEIFVFFLQLILRFF